MFVFVIHVRLPGDVAVVNGDNIAQRVLQGEGVREHTLSDQAAGGRNPGWVARDQLPVPEGGGGLEVRVEDYRGAVILDLVGGADLAHELLGVLGLDVPSVVLIEVVQLVVHVDWSRDLLLDDQRERARRGVRATVDVVLSELYFLDLVTHDVQHDAETQEHKAENGENDHG